MKKALLSGAVGVLGSDLAAGYVPSVVDVGGLPVRKAVAAVASVYLLNMAMKSGRSLKGALITGIAAVAAAEAATKFVPLHLAVGPLDAVRLGAGSLGAWGSSKVL